MKIHILILLLLLCLSGILSAQGRTFSIEEYENINSSRKKIAYLNKVFIDLPNEVAYELTDSVILRKIGNLLKIVEEEEKVRIEPYLINKYLYLCEYTSNKREAVDFVEKLDALPVFLTFRDTAYINYLNREYDGLKKESRVFVEEEDIKTLDIAREYVTNVEKYVVLSEELRTFEWREEADLARYEALTMRLAFIEEREQQFIPYQVRRKIILGQKVYDKVKGFKRRVRGLPELYVIDSVEQAKELASKMKREYACLSEVERKIVGNEYSVKMKRYEEYIASSEFMMEDSVSSKNIVLSEVIEANPLVLYFDNEKVIYGPRNWELMILMKYKKILKENPAARLMIVGYAVSCGKWNETLWHAKERAHSVKAQMELWGADVDHIHIDHRLVMMPKEFESEADVLKEYRAVRFLVSEK